MWTQVWKYRICEWRLIRWWVEQNILILLSPRTSQSSPKSSRITPEFLMSPGLISRQVNTVKYNDNRAFVTLDWDWVFAMDRWVRLLGFRLHGTCQHTATHCNTLQHTATPVSLALDCTGRANTLQHTATHCNTHFLGFRLKRTCHTLQHTATHCNTRLLGFRLKRTCQHQHAALS